MNRDVVVPVKAAVVTSPTPPTPTGMGFCGGTGIDRMGKGLGCGTISSMDEMEMVGLRMSRWVGLDSTPCTFWDTARGGGVGGHEGGGTLSSDVCFGGSTEAPPPEAGAGWGSSFVTGFGGCRGGIGSTSEMMSAGSSVVKVSRTGFAVSIRLRFLEMEPNHDPLRVSGMICSDTVSAGSSTRAPIRKRAITTHNKVYSLFSASCIDAICFSAVPGDVDLGSSGSANTSERVVLARASLVYGDRHLGLEL